jgi:hypothetical protein
MTGCSSLQITPVRDASRHAETDGRLMAFSIDQSKYFPLRSLELTVDDGESGQVSMKRVNLDMNSDGPTLALFSLPAGEVRFGTLRFYSQGAWWETNNFGPDIQLSDSGLTYIGRVQAQSIQVNYYDDTGKSYPASVKVTLEDFSEEDLPRMYAQFNIPDSFQAAKAIPASWNDAEFAGLTFRPIPGRHGRSDFGIAGPVGPELPPSRTRSQ